MKHLFVWMRRPTGALSLAGELAVTEPDRSSGRFESEFEYAAQWLRAPDAFAIDPVSLPLEERGQRFRAELFCPPLAVFDDALPDDWGRRLLAMALKLEGREPSPAEMLLRMRGGGARRCCANTRRCHRRTPRRCFGTWSSMPQSATSTTT